MLSVADGGGKKDEGVVSGSTNHMTEVIYCSASQQGTDTGRQHKTVTVLAP